MLAVRVKNSGEAERPDPEQSVSWAAPRQPRLRRVLIAGDAGAILAAWSINLGPLGGFSGSPSARLAVIGLLTSASLALIAGHQLYLARVCRLRTVEVSRLFRVSALVGLGVYLGGNRLRVDLSVLGAVAAVVVMAVSLTLSRSGYNAWLRGHRARGRHIRPVVVVGDRDDARHLGDLLERNPELGYTVVSSVAPTADVFAELEARRSDTVLLAAGAFGIGALNQLSRELLDRGVHVHLSSGLSGIDHRRLRAQPIAREPMFYLERATTAPWQLAVKRAVDIVGGTLGLLVALPVLLLAAVAVKLEDRGPIFFRAVRVGRNGCDFTMFKLRTMVPDADRQLHLVAAVNERTGPLFKSHNDPRITRVGRLLRAASIDELPQLLNVVLGSMSLVGPRPALAHEVAQFDDELRGRERVKPGITGLWQIEGRDDPSFDAYRRLDLFYVENWSLELDLVILLATAGAVVMQGMRELRGQWKPRTRELHMVDLTTPPTAIEGAQ